MVMSTPTTVMPTPTGSSTAPAFAWTGCASAAAVRPKAATRVLGFATAMSDGFNKTDGFNRTDGFNKTDGFNNIGDFNNTGDLAKTDGFNESNNNVIATRRPMNPPNRRSG
jgi:hypothetical protein